MSQKHLWHGVLVILLCMVLATPADAKGLPSAGEIVGAIVGVAVAIAVVAIVVVHESTKKRSITGCVLAEENKMRLTDEKNKRTYELSGNTAGIKPGDRTTLQGKKGNTKGAGKTLIWDVAKQTRDFGPCQP
jgi:hypothetical protein